MKPIALIAAAAVLLLAGGRATAQLPTATGRQFTLGHSQWKLFVPDGYTPRSDDRFDLLVHFHGDPQTVWNNADYAGLSTPIVTVNYSGLSSAYSGPFANTALFQELLDDAASTLAAQPDFGPGAAIDRLAVSSFSAGYGAVRRILATPGYFDAIDSLLAADSLYATTASDGTALDSQMVDYKAFASLAAAGEKRFVFTHSQVQTFTYESTAEVGDELLAHLGLTATPTQQDGLGDLSFYRTAESGGFSLWGAAGATGDDHLSHLRYMGEWLDELELGEQELQGDFNGDGAVDSADYTVWRDGLRWSYSPSDYDAWAANYGRTAASSVAVPEPTGLAIAITLVTASWRRRSSREWGLSEQPTG